MISPFTISLLMKALLTNNDVHKCFHSKRKDVQVLSKEMFEFNKILEGLRFSEKIFKNTTLDFRY